MWEEEFRGDAGSLPDPEVWGYDIGAGGWGNNELQYYTDRTENVQLNGDRASSSSRRAGTTTRVRSRGPLGPAHAFRRRTCRKFKYGRIDIRALAPVERGVWPALWMLGNDFGEVDWPLCGEIDIMEVFGQRGVGVAVHGPGYSGSGAVSFPYDGVKDDFANDFHIYSVIWDPQSIVWLIDENVVAKIDPSDLPDFTPWVFDHPFFFILNVAMGGNTVNPPNESTPDTNQLVVDYIKVYERTPPLNDPAGSDEEEVEDTEVVEEE